jgi:hypothetical protein
MRTDLSNEEVEVLTLCWFGIVKDINEARKKERVNTTDYTLTIHMFMSFALVMLREKLTLETLIKRIEDMLVEHRKPLTKHRVPSLDAYLRDNPFLDRLDTTA